MEAGTASRIHAKEIAMERRTLAAAAVTALPLVAGLALAFVIGLARAQPVTNASGFLTDPSGRTLYTFDEDAAGKPSCYGMCAFGWPPFLAPEGATASGAHSIVIRNDGSRQWAIDGKPLYRYVADFRAGDVRGDGKDGTWHVVKSGEKSSAVTPAVVPTMPPASEMSKGGY
jgi:predicted lipoprotein with Yx(FWY)xxD motif